MPRPDHAIGTTFPACRLNAAAPESVDRGSRTTAMNSMSAEFQLRPMCGAKPSSLRCRFSGMSSIVGIAASLFGCIWVSTTILIAFDRHRPITAPAFVPPSTRTRCIPDAIYILSMNAPRRAAMFVITQNKCNEAKAWVSGCANSNLVAAEPRMQKLAPKSLTPNRRTRRIHTPYTPFGRRKKRTPLQSATAWLSERRRNVGELSQALQ